MGKPYREELRQLPRTYKWARKQKLPALESALSALGSYPLLATGSGGSLSAAHFMAYLHQHFTQRVSKAITPLELSASPINFREVVVAFLTSGGRNPDILGSFRRVLSREPKRAVVLCARPGSPIARTATQYPFVAVTEFDLPSGKDGFLATNSLLASAVLLAKAYGQAYVGGIRLPLGMPGLLYPGKTVTSFLSSLRSRCRALWDRDTIVVLHGPSTQAAAIDLESKFSEAALGNVQACDYRNFAHGRHYWLAERGDKTAVLAFVSDEDQEIADKTLSLIPSNVHLRRVDLHHSGITAALAGIALVIHLVGLAGQATDSDPGRPRVPIFGRKLYRLSVFGRPRENDALIHSLEKVAIERKSHTSISILAQRDQLGYWRAAYNAFVSRLRAAVFGAVVFDYDGTLCDPAERFSSLSDEIVKHLRRLLRSDIVIGVATGRGKSVRKTFREAIPKRHWRQVLVGYYNGSDIGLLDDDTLPDKERPVHPSLQKIQTDLKGNALIADRASTELRPNQLTVVPTAYSWGSVRRLLFDKIAVLPGAELRVLESSHSFDILPKGISKLQLVSACDGFVTQEGNRHSKALCIGDKGAWPGNDCDLLSTEYSLSVDEVSSDPDTCWSLASEGCRGTRATLQYLERLVVKHGVARFQTITDPRR